jgi:single-stranded DNA-binding protein
MSKSVNKVLLLGNIGKDPEVYTRYHQSGRSRISKAMVSHRLLKGALGRGDRGLPLPQ